MVGIIKENKKVKKEKKYAIDQESNQLKKIKNDQEKKKENSLLPKKVRYKKNDNDQEKRRKEMEHAYLASFFRYIQFGRIDK